MDIRCLPRPLQILSECFTYNRRNPFEGLVEFKGSSERDDLEVGLENPDSFPNTMNFFKISRIS